MRTIALQFSARGEVEVVDDGPPRLRQRFHPVAQVRVARLAVDLGDVDTPPARVVKHGVEAPDAGEEICVPERCRVLRHASKLS